MMESSTLPSASSEAKPTVSERIKQIRTSQWIEYPMAKALRTRMVDLLDYPTDARMPNIALSSPSNNGKSKLLESFNRVTDPTRQPDYSVNNDNIERPVISFQAPPEGDEARFYDRILSVLFAPGSTREPVDSKLRRVSKLLRSLKTRVLVVDEFGFMQAATPAKQRKALNALKFLSNELQISMIVAGVPEIVNLITSDAQIASRFDDMDLPVWTMSEDYQRLLVTLERRMGLENPSHLAQDEIAERILSETGGILGDICGLVKRLAIDAVESGAETIPASALDAKNLKRIGWKAPGLRHRGGR